MKLYISENDQLQRGVTTGGSYSASEVKAQHGNGEDHVVKRMLLLLLLMAAVFILATQSAYAAMYFSAFPASPDADTQVRLDWSPVPGAQIYQIYRDDGSGSSTTAASISYNVHELTYTDTGLQANKGYTYTIKAFSNTTPPVLLDGNTVQVKTEPMIRPYGVSALYDINARAVLLKWSSSACATRSTIYRTENGAPISIPIDTTTSAIIPENGQDLLRFTVQSIDSAGNKTSESNAVSITPIALPGISAVVSGSTATISWSEYTQINQFQLERSKWNETANSWDSWITVNSSLSGQNAVNTLTSGSKYRYRLAAKSGSGYVGYSNISQTVSRLSAPTGLSLTTVNTEGIDLTWTNTNGNSSNIQVMRRLANGSYSQIAMLPGSAASYHDTITVTAGATYTYRVCYYENASNYSAAAEASFLAAVPSAPTALRAYVISSTSITLSWTDNSNNESGFSVERMDNSGSFKEIDRVLQDIGSYTDDSVSAGNTYTYRIRSTNAFGNSSYSNEVTINAWDSIAPIDLVVTPISETRLDLAWSYAGTAGYNTTIERKTGTGGTWSVIYTTAQGTLKYSDTGLSSNTRYFYRVSKSLGAGSTGISFPNNEIGIGAYTYLGNFYLAGSATSANTIYLTWSGNTGNADVIIERKMANGSFSALMTVGSSTTGWYDNTGLVPNASYTYRIKGRTLTNESVYSNELTVQNVYLEAPSGLRASVNSNSAIELKWTDNSTDETGFEIWRYVYGSGKYILYTTVDKNVTAYTDSTIQTGVQYYYMVRAYIASSSLYSPYSNSASIGAGLVNPPANLHYTYVSGSQVLLKWTDASDDESGFKIEWKVGQDGSWNTYAGLSSNTTSYTVYNLNTYIKYYFRIRAYRYSGNADSLSNEILVSTAIPASPSDVAAIALSASRVKINWKDNSDSETGFRIMRRSASASSFEALSEVGKDITAYTDYSVKASTRYYYKVVSFNALGSSESSEVEVKTNARATFTDLGSVASWAKDAIENLAGMGIVKGVSGTLYKPNNTISKAEFTAMVVRTFKLDTVPVGSFADVKPGQWYYKEIMIAENFGIITGDNKNRYYPETAITREEIAVILFKALEASGREYTGHDNTVLERFTDRNMISPYAVASMATLVGEGIIEGLSGDAIGPHYTATRAQAAVFLYRAMDK